MKKMICILLLLCLLTCSACAEPVARVAALKGPTAMGMVQMLDTHADYEATIAAAADEITPLLVQGKLDIAAVPANLAAVLYNNTEGAVRVLAINTLGVLYIVERGENVQSIQDLRGKTIYTAGKGSTPEYALNHVLRQSGLNPETDVNIEFKSEHAECLAALIANPDAVAMLPQPFATVAQQKAEDMRIALDLSAEWDALAADSAMITGVVIARTEWLNDNPEAAAKFMDDYAASVQFTKDSPTEAAQLIGQFDIIDATVAEKALPYCNITFIEGAEMQTLLSGYYETLFAQEPASVGGKLPDADFYYAR